MLNPVGTQARALRLVRRDLRTASSSETDLKTAHPLIEWWWTNLSRRGDDQLVSARVDKHISMRVVERLVNTR